MRAEMNPRTYHQTQTDPPWISTTYRACKFGLLSQREKPQVPSYKTLLSICYKKQYHEDSSAAGRGAGAGG